MVQEQGIGLRIIFLRIQFLGKIILAARIRNFFTNLTLSQRFMLASLVILLAGMTGIGAWVEKQIETGVIHRTGATTALYVDSFVAPNLQELGYSNELLPENVDALSKLVQNTSMGQQIVAFKVWDTRGKLLYSTDPSTIGKTYPMQEHLLRARLGEVVSEVSPLEEEENAPLATVYEQLLETYSPVWLSGTDQIIAVAEFYQSTDELEREIGVLKRRSWLVVGLAILSMYLLLSVFVRKASDTITLQQTELGRRVRQLTELLSQNRELHERVRRAAASVALLNESYLRRIGSELHDGPAQDLGLSLLKLDSLIGQVDAHLEDPLDQATLEQLGAIEASLQNAQKEVRGIAAGLSLPQLSDLSLSESVVRVVRAHERQTGTQVGLELEPIQALTPLPLKITVYRLIQEGLNNAYRHGKGADQQVHVYTEEDQIVVEISDRGPGFKPEQAREWNGRLGLSGMRERVESLGGQFEIRTEIGKGTMIIAILPSLIDGGSQG
jgi:signal transduction histidine kinase